MSEASLPELVLFAAQLAVLGLLTVGGVQSVLPELQRLVVSVHGWMSGGEFAALIALSQALPGPNALFTVLIGYRIAGVLGAALATFAFIVPTSLLTYAISGYAAQGGAARLRAVLRDGLAPMTVGLVLAGGYVLAEDGGLGHAGLAIAIATALLSVWTRWHPLVYIAAGGIVGLLLPGV
jgi:chromate transporter